MRYEKNLIIPSSTAKNIKNLLSTRGSMSKDETIVNTATFDDEIKIDVKVCGADGDFPWTEAVLFKNGCECWCCYIKVCGDYFGTWKLEDGDENRYIVNVVAEDESEG